MVWAERFLSCATWNQEHYEEVASHSRKGMHGHEYGCTEWDKMVNSGKCLVLNCA